MHKNINKYFFIDNFDTKILDYQDKHTSIIFRNYQNKISNLNPLIKLRNYCKNKNFKFYISNDIKLALKINADGAYIPSFNKSTQHLNYSTSKDFKIIGSAHNINEIRIKETQKVDQIVISSLFKKNKNYLGFYRFCILKKLTKKRVIALGGVTKKNLKKFYLIDCDSFAGITYFKKKGP